MITNYHFKRITYSVLVKLYYAKTLEWFMFRCISSATQVKQYQVLNIASQFIISTDTRRIFTCFSL
jgi:hypothetical protein